MRKITIELLASFFLICFMNFESKAQCSFEKLSRDYETKHNKLESYNNKGVLRLSTVSPCGTTQIELIDFCNGDKIWQTNIWNNGFANCIAKNNIDSSIVLGTSNWMQGDVIMPAEIGMIFINSTGSIYRSFTFLVDSVFPQITSDIWFRNIEVASNAKVFASIGNQIIKIDTAGNILAQVSTTGIINAFVLDELQQTVTILTTNEIGSYDLDLNAISTKHIGKNYTAIAQSDSNYFIATASNKIYRANTQWDFVDSIQLSDEIVKIRYADNSLFALLKSASENYSVNQYSSFQSIQNSYIIQNDFTPLDFTIYDDFIKIGGKYIQHFNNYSYYQSLPISATQYTPSDFDIGVVDVAFENYSQTPNPNPVIPGQNSLIVKFDIIATVKNFSNKPVSKFAVYSNVLGGMNCAHWLYFNISDTILNPNDSIKIKVGTFNYPYNSPNTSIGICINSVSPNEEADRDTSNDKFCQRIYINSIEDLAPFRICSIYPIPASKQLFLTMNTNEYADNTRFIITDIHGSRILEKNISTEETTLDVSQFMTGIYFYRILENGIDRQKGKFIVE